METKNKNVLAEISILLVFTLVAFFFWDTYLIYPIKVLVVLFHEISHGLAAVFTGGSIVKIEIDPRIGGVCYSQGGVSFIVASAGYFGSILWGGAILLLSQKTKYIKYIMYFLAAVIFAFTVLFVRNTFGFIFGILVSGALLLILKFAPEVVQVYLLRFIGMVSCFYVLIDIKEDLFTTQYRGSDSDFIASMTGLPSIFWGILWFVLSLLVFIYFVRKIIKK